MLGFLPRRKTNVAKLLILLVVVLITHATLKTILLNKDYGKSLFNQSSLHDHRNKHNIENKISSIYISSPVETYVLNNSESLGYNESNKEVQGCQIWRNKTNNPIYEDLQRYLKDLDVYATLVNEFTPVKEDLRRLLKKKQNNNGDCNFKDNIADVCDLLKLHPHGLKGIFNSSNQLSQTRSSGYVEPLLPPMRHPKYCFNGGYVFDLDYLVHDFEYMCRQLLPTSRTVFIDMGASLKFHREKVPVFELLDLYKKFGFIFDHIYAFEITFTDPNEVFQLVPKEYMSSYHWINAGVVTHTNSTLHPFDSIVSKFDEDDIVIVKLDVDNANVEMPLAYQLLQNEQWSKVIDQFYFEHHVYMKEIARAWRESMNGSIQESLQLFSDLRKLGVPSHFWV